MISIAFVVSCNPLKKSIQLQPILNNVINGVTAWSLCFQFKLYRCSFLILTIMYVLCVRRLFALCLTVLIFPALVILSLILLCTVSSRKKLVLIKVHPPHGNTRLGVIQAPQAKDTTDINK